MKKMTAFVQAMQELQEKEREIAKLKSRIEGLESRVGILSKLNNDYAHVLLEVQQ